MFVSTACAADEEKDGAISTDILLNGKKFEITSHFSWDIPDLTFSSCRDPKSANSTRYATLVHEAGHALGVRGTERSGGTEDQIHHSQIEDSVMKSGSFDTCAPTPFDLMAIYALYQADD